MSLLYTFLYHVEWVSLCLLSTNTFLRVIWSIPQLIYYISSGIGLEAAILFLREGAQVLLADISEAALAKAVARIDTVLPTHPQLATTKCDVSVESDVAAMITQVDAWGGVDILFNNAGIMHAADAGAIDTPEAIWDLTHKINVKGVWYGCKHAIHSFQRHAKRNASVINTASVVALVGSATPQLAYTASKGAVLALTRELAIVHARDGWRFNALCPAPLNTPLLQDWLGDDQAKRLRREIHLPSGRFGEPIEQAHAALFLASDEASFVNGTDFVVDGGMSRVCLLVLSSMVLMLTLRYQAYVTPEGPPTMAPQNNGRA